MAAGEAAAARGRAGVEAKLGTLTDRLLHMARKEAKREKRRGGPSFFSAVSWSSKVTDMLDFIVPCPGAPWTGVAQNGSFVMLAVSHDLPRLLL